MGISSENTPVFLPNPLTILLVDDHQVYIDGVKLALAGMPVAVNFIEANSVAEARKLLTYAKLPDLILLDLNLPDASGKSLLSESVPRAIPVIVLSALDDASAVHAMLAEGACGFVSKTQGAADIIKACLCVLNGERYIPPFVQSTPPPASLEGINTELAKNHGLTRRQMEVLRLLAIGLQNKLICDRLNLTEDTVKSHLKQLFSNLKVRNRTECVATARQLGIVISTWLTQAQIGSK